MCFKSLLCFRLLVCGGAKLYNVKLPAKNPYKYSEHLTYLFVDATTAPLTKSLQDYGVLCLDADFISDYIVLVRINYLCVGRFIEILNHFENKKSKTEMTATASVQENQSKQRRH